MLYLFVRALQILFCDFLAPNLGRNWPKLKGFFAKKKAFGDTDSPIVFFCNFFILINIPNFFFSALGLQLDPYFRSLQLLVQQDKAAKVHTLREFSQVSIDIPSFAPHVTELVRELQNSSELLVWITSLGNESLQHEINILKSKMVGDTHLVSLLGDLETVKETLFRLGLTERSQTSSQDNNNSKCTFTEFVQALSATDWKCTATQLRAVRNRYKC